MYLIWALINAAFVILFFALVLTFISKGRKIFDNKYRNLFIVILGIGVISLIGIDSKTYDNTYSFDTDGVKGNNVKNTRAIIEDNFLFDINFSVRFKKNNAGELIPSFSRSNMTGFISGYDWEYQYATIDKLENGSISYEVVGLMHWHLFGIQIYTQPKTFNGTLEE